MPRRIYSVHNARLSKFVQFIRKVAKCTPWQILVSIIGTAIYSGLQKEKNVLVVAITYIVILAGAIIWTLICKFMDKRKGDDLEVLRPLCRPDGVVDEGALLANVALLAKLVDKVKVNAALFTKQMSDIKHCCTPSAENLQRPSPARIQGVFRFPTSPNVQEAHVKLNMDQLQRQLNADIWTMGSLVLHKSLRMEITFEHPSVDVLASQLLVSMMQPHSIDKDATFQGESKSVLDDLASQLLESMRLAYRIDKDATFQLGNFAIFKYADDGPRYWKLQEHWTPIILDISRSRSLLDYIHGHTGIWTIQGFYLRDAKLKASTIDRVEPLTVLSQHQRSSGADVITCKEPLLVGNWGEFFRRKMYIAATREITTEEDQVTFVLHSEATNVQKVYFISVMKGILTIVMVLTLLLIPIAFAFLALHYIEYRQVIFLMCISPIAYTGYFALQGFLRYALQGLRRYLPDRSENEDGENLIFVERSENEHVENLVFVEQFV